MPGSRARRVLSAAAERARLRFANREAMGYLEVAVALLARLPDDDERRRQQLEIRLRLGALLIDLRGFASEPVRENYERAAELCPAVGREAQHFEVAYARWYLQVARGERDQAIAGAAQMETLARRLGNWQRAVAASSLDRAYVPELWRLKGELLLNADCGMRNQRLAANAGRWRIPNPQSAIRNRPRPSAASGAP